VYYPIVTASEFKTFDVKLDELLTLKRKLALDMLNGCGEPGPGEFTDIVQVDDNVFDERIGVDACADLDPLEFEALIAVLWKKRGFRTVTLTPLTRDGGVDVLAKTVDQGALIQCKSSRTHRAALDWEAVKDVVAGAAHYSFEHPGVTFKKVAVTNQFFNDYARHHAGLNNVELVDQDSLRGLLETHRVVRGEIDALLASRR
jgi:HJR/Mrr/RecB family endonuclease